MYTVHITRHVAVLFLRNGYGYVCLQDICRIVQSLGFIQFLHWNIVVLFIF
jgi:hypothetical protein